MSKPRRSITVVRSAEGSGKTCGVFDGPETPQVYYGCSFAARRSLMRPAGFRRVEKEWM